MHTKAMPATFETKTSSDGSKGIVTAFVSVYDNVDLDGDVTAPGAFDNDVKAAQEAGDPIPWVFSHKSSDLDHWIGTVDPHKIETDAEFTTADGETRRGLKVEAVMPIKDDPDARKAFGLLQTRALKQFSFAYEIVRASEPAEKARKSQEHRQTLEELKLFECGPCLRGANPMTNLVAAKDIASAAVKAVEQAKHPQSGKQYDEVGMPAGVWVGGYFIGVDSDGEFDDEAVSACAIRMAADLIVLAGCAEAPDGTADEDAADDDNQAAELRRIAGELSAVGFDIVSTDESEALDEAGKTSPVSLQRKGLEKAKPKQSAQSIAAELVRQDYLDLIER
jgi:HK97 family phage prohead protease